MPKKNLLIFGVLALIIIFAIIFRAEKSAKVCFEADCFRAEIADSPQERSRGLMFREKLNSDQAMLFVFEKEQKRSFWMKKVPIALDIIWISEDKKVVFVSKNNQPCQDTCPLIEPAVLARYVLEIKGGLFDQLNLELGQEVDFKI